ncbi:MAG: UDP-N-acetylmuramoyl-L-alanine--D-glutamate ligase [Phycisphaerales bacterium]|jgi:UDP-N-acetylmuramoylalanine--D-glutamate ligase|nr:UDP-N-acetylmuramoyl-L-alanine--D-glutamate ligase [Phycisphaerales bacterium]
MATLADQRVVVMGLGTFGGGVGCVSWLLEQGADVTITDLRDEQTLGPSLSEFEHQRCRLVLGRHKAADFAEADLIIVNPAVPKPWSNPYLKVAEEAGIPMCTEISLLTDRLDRRCCIGITGTAGKSTTAAMTHHLLTAAGHDAVLGGNIGGSLLPRLGDIGADTWVVLELSSAQLYWLGQGGGWSPSIAGITNIAPNHLDWHGDMDHYLACKESIAKTQTPEDMLIRGEHCDALPADIELLVPGEHNRINAAMAVTLASAATNVSPDTLRSFRGLPHRLAAVGENSPKRFFDDSKSTTPEATVLAVKSFGDSTRIHLIAGGYDKGVSLAAIVELAPNLAGLYTIGATGGMLSQSVGSASTHCGTLDLAVTAAIARMRDGDVLLLSPGCASWDQFPDYRARGEAFAVLVAEAVGHGKDPGADLGSAIRRS